MPVLRRRVIHPSRGVTLLFQVLGPRDIWVKAMTATRGQIAQYIGAHHVVNPEAHMGARGAHLISRRMMDCIEFDDGIAIAKIHAPAVTHGQTLQACGVRKRFGVTVVGVKRAQEDFRHATPETAVQAGDLLIVSGPTRQVEKSAGQSVSRSDLPHRSAAP